MSLAEAADPRAQAEKEAAWLAEHLATGCAAGHTENAQQFFPYFFLFFFETTGFLQASSTTDGRGPGEGQFSVKDSTKTGDPGGVGFPNFVGKVEKHESTKPYIDACGFSRRQRRIIMHLTLMVVSQCPLTTCLDSMVSMGRKTARTDRVNRVNRANERWMNMTQLQSAQWIG